MAMYIFKYFSVSSGLLTGWLSWCSGVLGFYLFLFWSVLSKCHAQPPFYLSIKIFSHSNRRDLKIICPFGIINVSIPLHAYKQLRFDPILIHK